MAIIFKGKPKNKNTKMRQKKRLDSKGGKIGEATLRACNLTRSLMKC